MSCVSRLLAAFVCVVLVAPNCRAALLFTSEIRAEFEFSILSSGPLDSYGQTIGIPRDVFLDYVALGSLTFELDDSFANATSLPFQSVTGRLNGISPAPIFSISPVQFLGGTLDNIVRDGSNNIVSGDVNNLSMRWEILVLEGDPNLERRAFTLAGLPFSGAVGGTPFAFGDTISGPSPGPVDVFWDQDLNNPAAVVQNRSLQAVPEPSSAALLALGLTTTLLRRRKR